MGDIHQATVHAFNMALVTTPMFVLVLTLLGMATVLGIFSSSQRQKGAESRFARQVAKTRDFGEMCAVFGYEHEEHTVVTEDGYVLSLQRILPRDEDEATAERPVVYLQHGLCTNSELFMAVSSPQCALPLVLVENGYDVWLGNNR